MTNNKSCATCDADGTGRNNRFKYAAGLDPTNPTQVFNLNIQSTPGQPKQQNLTYRTVMPGRTYTSEFVASLPASVWSALTINGMATNGSHVTVTDANATQIQKFYRVHVAFP